jgi:hypothetical protein
MTMLGSGQLGIPRPVPGAITPPMSVVATTDTPGFALQNGTPNIISWTAPNDGQMHRFMLNTTQVVSVLEVGGQVNLNWTNPDGTAFTPVQYGAGNAVGAHSPSAQVNGVCKSGQTVTLAQTTALTSGAVIVWAELWAS